MTSRAIALLGSGEFEPWAEQIDRWLLQRTTGDGTVLILPTASAPEGDSVFDMWAEMGRTHYAGLGIPAEVLPLKTAEDAARPDLAERLGSASMAFFSGGNPAYLAAVLAGSRFWTELLRNMGRGLAYAGCSAGIAALGEVAIDSAARQRGDPSAWKPGLRLFPNLFLGPHWDALDAYIPGLQAMFRAAVPPGSRLLAVDEHTAVAGDGAEWTVMGSGSATLIEGASELLFPAGATFSAEFLGADLAPA